MSIVLIDTRDSATGHNKDRHNIYTNSLLK